MANNENLKPIRNVNEAREKGKKGGMASGKKRAERKQLKEELLLLLSENDVQKKLSLALITKAMNGDVRAFETIRDTIGEKPVDKQEVTNTTPQIVVANQADADILQRIANVKPKKDIL